MKIVDEKREEKERKRIDSRTFFLGPLRLSEGLFARKGSSEKGNRTGDSEQCVCGFVARGRSTFFRKKKKERKTQQNIPFSSTDFQETGESQDKTKDTLMENEIQQKLARYESFVNEGLRKDLKDTLDARDTIYDQISE